MLILLRFRIFFFIIYKIRLFLQKKRPLPRKNLAMVVEQIQQKLF